MQEAADEIRRYKEIISKYNSQISSELFTTFKNNLLETRANKVRNPKDLEKICNAFLEMEGKGENSFKIQGKRNPINHISSRCTHVDVSEIPCVLRKTLGDNLDPYKNMQFPLTTYEVKDFEIPTGGLLYGLAKSSNSHGVLFYSERRLSYDELKKTVQRRFLKDSGIWSWPSLKIETSEDNVHSSLFRFAKDLGASKLWEFHEQLIQKKAPPNFINSSKNGELMYSRKTDNYIVPGWLKWQK